MDLLNQSDGNIGGVSLFGWQVDGWLDVEPTEFMIRDRLEAMGLFHSTNNELACGLELSR